MIKSVSDLEIFKLAYSFATDIFQLTRSFPKEERYSLTDQIVRASRSITANIAEGWGKRIYENELKKHWFTVWARWKSQKFGYCSQKTVTTFPPKIMRLYT